MNMNVNMDINIIMNEMRGIAKEVVGGGRDTFPLVTKEEDHNIEHNGN